ncbi:pseudouridine synthase [Mesoplasma lactucae]|uniref:RNA pseudouridylate synthase n=1 Tax=Mesoplasma lactucae ATCC 49193 TaxID=81460 RepID=A0A291IS66_9MOLU|nr:RluA family pseudouridine synthase [Mesoplasma lactucae]ATG97613.1 pseudouridine synthase [Mesoplasma lactucae ATCC 49193]ATZ19926.1 23S rRNA pseudouridine955/2504/2580 synthase [Mesoplasma lactucae ATCC 49193]MCL8216790.1 Ribosomal large subunit pseudouridine synthase C [Mesoplasma lactucae ATCC 49193]
MKTYIVKDNDANQSVFKFLKKMYSTTPLSVIYKWFRKKDIKLNGKRISDQKIVLKAGDEVVVYDNNDPVMRDKFEKVNYDLLDVVYEDENILVANKPANIEMHSEFNISLDNMVKSYLIDKKEYNPEDSQSFVVSHVHRLDKLTQGLVIYAKNKPSLDELLDAIKTKIDKKYVLRTRVGFPKDLVAKGFIYYDQDEQLSIYTNHKNDRRAKECETDFKVLSENKDFSLVEATLKTGRKHQIRASVSYFNFPIINDFRYGGMKINNEKMIFLKAYKIIFHNLNAPLQYLNETIIEISKDFK